MTSEQRHRLDDLGVPLRRGDIVAIANDDGKVYQDELEEFLANAGMAQRSQIRSRAGDQVDALGTETGMQLHSLTGLLDYYTAREQLLTLRPCFQPLDCRCPWHVNRSPK